jgi:hypothetical protein
MPIIKPNSSSSSAAASNPGIGAALSKAVVLQYNEFGEFNEFEEFEGLRRLKD